MKCSAPTVPSPPYAARLYADMPPESATEIAKLQNINFVGKVHPLLPDTGNGGVVKGIFGDILNATETVIRDDPGLLA